MIPEKIELNIQNCFQLPWALFYKHKVLSSFFISQFFFCIVSISIILLCFIQKSTIGYLFENNIFKQSTENSVSEKPSRLSAKICILPQKLVYLSEEI